MYKRQTQYTYTHYTRTRYGNIDKKIGTVRPFVSLIIFNSEITVNKGITKVFVAVYLHWHACKPTQIKKLGIVLVLGYWLAVVNLSGLNSRTITNTQSSMVRIQFFQSTVNTIVNSFKLYSCNQYFDC